MQYIHTGGVLTRLMGKKRHQRHSLDFLKIQDGRERLKIVLHKSTPIRGCYSEELATPSAKSKGQKNGT